MFLKECDDKNKNENLLKIILYVLTLSLHKWDKSQKSTLFCKYLQYFPPKKMLRILPKWVQIAQYKYYMKI